VLPGLTFAEKRGTFTNIAGRVQRIDRAIDPETQPSDGEIVIALGRRLGMTPTPFDPEATLAAIGRAVPAYAAVTWDGLGSQGLPTADA
jgi:predicted molibdopterin-dependent oxidoreductase YjgC